MHIRKTPRLRFHPDTGIREGFDIIKKLEGLVAESHETAENEPQ
jgi:ribosome-binding factor A